MTTSPEIVAALNSVGASMLIALGGAAVAALLIPVLSIFLERE